MAYPVLYAHRGASNEFPENTLPAFQRAIDRGADALELDVHMTRDGQLVVAHDPSGERVAGVPLRIAEVTLAELQTWDAGRGFVGPDGTRPFAGRGIRIPTLLDVLECFATVPLNIDVKHHTSRAIRATISMLRRFGADLHTTLASFSPRLVRLARKVGFGGQTALTRNEALVLVLAPAALARVRRFERVRAQLPVRIGPLDLGGRAFIAKCHAFGLHVDYWTVNDPAEAARLLDHGADGLMTDDVMALLPVVERRRKQLEGRVGRAS